MQFKYQELVDKLVSDKKLRDTVDDYMGLDNAAKDRKLLSNPELKEFIGHMTPDEIGETLGRAQYLTDEADERDLRRWGYDKEQIAELRTVKYSKMNEEHKAAKQKAKDEKKRADSEKWQKMKDIKNRIKEIESEIKQIESNPEGYENPPGHMEELDFEKTKLYQELEKFQASIAAKAVLLDSIEEANGTLDVYYNPVTRQIEEVKTFTDADDEPTHNFRDFDELEEDNDWDKKVLDKLQEKGFIDENGDIKGGSGDTHELKWAEMNEFAESLKVMTDNAIANLRDDLAKQLINKPSKEIEDKLMILEKEMNNRVGKSVAADERPVTTTEDSHSQQQLQDEVDKATEGVPKEDVATGVDIEKEHKPTFEKIKEYYETHNEMPTPEMVYTWIALDHLNEFKKYYDKEAGLPHMEEELTKLETMLTNKVNAAITANSGVNTAINLLHDYRNIKEIVITAILTQKHNAKTNRKEWALVSKHDSSKILKWFGTDKPSEEAVNKEEKRVQYFKNMGAAEEFTEDEAVIRQDLQNVGFDFLGKTNMGKGIHMTYKGGNLIEHEKKAVETIKAKFPDLKAVRNMTDKYGNTDLLLRCDKCEAIIEENVGADKLFVSFISAAIEAEKKHSKQVILEILHERIEKAQSEEEKKQLKERIEFLEKNLAASIQAFGPSQTIDTERYFENITQAIRALDAEIEIMRQSVLDTVDDTAKIILTDYSQVKKDILKLSEKKNDLKEKVDQMVQNFKLLRR